VLRSVELNKLIGHPKDRTKDDLNSMTNSLQPGETNAGEDQA
jgi:hypothetical protein